MNFFTSKVINLFTVVLSAIFFLSAVMSIVTSVQEENKITLEFERMMNEIEAFNYTHSLQNIDNDSEVVAPEDALFNNGIDAFISAYYNYIDAPSYHVVSRGYSTNTVLLNLNITITVRTESKNVMIKYPDGDTSYELISYEEGNTYGRSGAKYIYYSASKNLVYMAETADVRKINDDLVAFYSGSWQYDSVEAFQLEAGILPGESIYDFNKRSIVEATYYKEIKVNNKVTEYQTQIISNPTLAGKPYAKIIKYMGNATEMPRITEMKTSAIIGGDGVLKALMFNDAFELKTQVPVLGEKTVKCKSNSTYYFLTIGGEVLLAKPDVSNATAR